MALLMVLSEAEDSEYMELAKEPEKNEERLNELVSKAARKAMPNSKITDEDGRLLVVYHGTAYLQDFNGNYYRIILSVGNNNGIGTVYNVGKITKDKLPTATLIAVVRSKPLGSLSLDDSITSAPGKSQEKNSYALSEAEDSEYIELAKEPEKNEERLNELVSKAARKAGYNSPKLYHGTSLFGFTKFDLAKMDDGISIFLLQLTKNNVR